MPFWIVLSLFLPLARYTPQHRVLIYKNKTKGQYESFEPHWHRSLQRVRMSRPAIPNLSTVIKLFFWLTYYNITEGNAGSSHAKLWIRWNIRHGRNHKCCQYGRALTMTVIVNMHQHNNSNLWAFGDVDYCNDRTLSYKPFLEHNWPERLKQYSLLWKKMVTYMHIYM